MSSVGTDEKVKKPVSLGEAIGKLVGGSDVKSAKIVSDAFTDNSVEALDDAKNLAYRSCIPRGMVVVGMAILTGFHILGSGTTDTGVSAVIKGSFFAFIFALVAFQGGVLLASVPVVGSVALMGLSVLYVVGVVDMFGHPSGA